MKWRLYAAAWIPLLLLHLAAFSTFGLPWGEMIRNVVVYLLPGAFLGAFVLKLVEKNPMPTGDKSSFLLFHGLRLGAFMIASTLLWIGLVYLDRLVFKGSFGSRFDFRVLPWRLTNDVMVYGTLACLGYAGANAARNRELEKRASRAEALRVQAELEALRNQLHPHFILNTLHALIGLVRRDPPIAEQALERLGDLLRYSLKLQRERLDMVPLSDEWAFVQSYVELERLRLGERLTTSFRTDDEAMDAHVPSFAVQTLVENAIRHAIAPRVRGGRLLIDVSRSNGRLTIRVEDDGPGKTDGAESRTVGGLRLLRDRLQALYGADARLLLTDRNPGLAAVLELPAASAGEVDL